MRIQVLLTIICFIISPLESFDLRSSQNAAGPEDCLPLKNVITDAITAAGISFFADHPRENRTFDPNSVDPFTPSKLFKQYYGADASSAEITKAIFQINFAAREYKVVPVDRDELRRNLYEYIKAGSYEYAREKTGELFRVIIVEFAKDKEAWANTLCLGNDVVYDALEAVEVECYRIRNEVGDVKFGQLFALGVGSTLAFAIDDTGSMSGEIEAAKRRAQRIVEYTRGTLDAPQDFVLVPFNDPDVGPVAVTTDAGEYHYALDDLQAHGGGDTPELAMRGIQLAIEKSRPGSIIYVITDAEAKDYHLQDTVIAQARQKSIIVTFLLTHQIGECRDEAEYKRCMGLYEHIARQTGGKLLVIGRSDIFRATDIVQTYAKQGIVLLQQVTIKADQTDPHSVVHFNVDSTLQELLLEAQGSCENVTLSTPDAENNIVFNEERYGDIWTSSVNFKDLENVTTVGPWSIEVTVRNENCTLKIQAKTTMGFLLTLLGKEKEQSDNDYKILREDPFVESTLGAIIEFYGFRDATNEDESSDEPKTLKSVDEYGNVLLTTHEPFSKRPVKGNSVSHIFENDVMQHGPFRILLEGIDRSGHKFQRMDPRLFTPSHVHIHCDLSDLIFLSGVETNANITIGNFGPEEEFLVTVSDGYLVASFGNSTTSKTIRIRRGQTVTKRLKLFNPSGMKDGTAIDITITAKGKLPGSFQYSTCTLVVGQKRKPRIDSFSVKATINARLAETVVTSVVTNNADVGREAIFDMLLPQDAFISGIRIELQNETIYGAIEEKKRAQKIYQRAKQRGTVAGHVATRDTSTRAYRTSMFVEARQKVRFVLTYQQLLRRVRGRYEYAVILKPDQPIRSLSIDVHISEEDPLLFVKVPPLKTTLTNLPDDTQPPGTAITFSRHDTSAHIHYQPSIEQQTKWSPKGISGTFFVEYDVQRPELFGQVAVNNGYFAHFFAPPSLPPVPKIVVFVVDTSGSMYGYKMRQMKEALKSTLLSLNPDDLFGIVYFGDEVWGNQYIIPTNEKNFAQAVDEIDQLTAKGGTNMEGAFHAVFNLIGGYLPDLPEVESSGTELGSGESIFNVTEVDDGDGDRRINESSAEAAKREESERINAHVEAQLKPYRDNYAKLVIFMTDGRATVRETDPNEIARTVREGNGGRFVLHTIGLGSLVDFNFLDKLAHENGGMPRRIFEGIDADVQIRNFMEEITNPILRDVTIDYPIDRVDDLTVNTFPVFLGGSELVIAGKVRPDAEKIESDSGLEDLEVLDGLSPSVVSPTGGRPGLITAQVRGRAYRDVLEIDFDLDPAKESKIIESQHQVGNFTEKLWAFLRLKELLVEASIEEDPYIKEIVNEKALNMSLKYELVSPLTSLVVVRPDEKIALEKELERELAEEKRKEEERKRKEEEERGKVGPPLYFPGYEGRRADEDERAIGEFPVTIPRSFLECEEDGEGCYDIDECSGPACMRIPGDFGLECTGPGCVDYGEDVEECIGPDCYASDAVEVSMACDGPGCVEYADRAKSDYEIHESPHTLPPGFAVVCGPDCEDVEVSECYGPRCLLSPGGYEYDELPILPTTTIPRFTTRTPSHRSGGGGGGGGFSGDPHFVIPIKPKISICFNWDGEEGEIYNLLHDPVKGIIVNGMLTNAPSPPSSGRTKRTYVSKLGILLPSANKKILISPWNITVVEKGAPNFTLPVSAKLTFRGVDGVVLRIKEIARSSVTIIITCKELQFAVILRHTPRGAQYSRDHLDFGLLNDLRSLSRESDGVFGQFASLFSYARGSSSLGLLGNARATGKDRQIRRELYIRGDFVPVVRRKMTMPSTGKETFCWYIHKNGADVMRKRKNQFQLNNVFDIPSVE